MLGELKARGVAIDGIAIRDRPEDVAAFLDRNGDPYRADRRRSATAGCSWRSARRACRKPSSSMAAASSATSISARSSRATCRLILARVGAGASEALAAAALLLIWRRRRSPTATCPRRNGPTASCPIRARRPQAKALMEELRCLVCQGQSIADSDAELAGDMRAHGPRSAHRGGREARPKSAPG